MGAFGKRSRELHKYPADDVVAMLGLSPHPEGGFFREIFRDAHLLDDGRNASTAIYFLLTKDKPLHWHRMDAAEVWHWYAGAPLMLQIFDGKELSKIRLSNNLMEGERPQAVVPAKSWQMAQTQGEWTLVGCTVSPGFTPAGFEMAASDWKPPLK